MGIKEDGHIPRFFFGLKNWNHTPEGTDIAWIRHTLQKLPTEQLHNYGKILAQRYAHNPFMLDQVGQALSACHAPAEALPFFRLAAATYPIYGFYNKTHQRQIRDRFRDTAIELLEEVKTMKKYGKREDLDAADRQAHFVRVETNHYLETHLDPEIKAVEDAALRARRIRIVWENPVIRIKRMMKK